MKHSLKEQVKGSLIRPLRSRVATGLSPTFKIPLIESVSSVPSGLVSTFTRSSIGTYIDDDGLLQTVASGVPRFQNGKYLVELAATNLFLQSGTPATQMITVVSGSVYTVQCFGAGNITLSGAGTGTVVQGTPITFTASSTTLICTVTGLLSRAQVELGSKATSYIPTTAAPMTRAGDNLYYNVSSVITQGQGSLYFEFVGVIDNGYMKMPITISDGTANNRFYPCIINTGTLNIEFWTSGVLNGMYSSGVVSLVLNKTLITYKTGEVKLYNNGILLSTKTTVILPLGLNRLNIGSSHDGHFQLNSEIGNVKYFKEILTPAEAIKLTTL